jgi:hypothetical protein
MATWYQLPLPFEEPAPSPESARRAPFAVLTDEPPYPGDLPQLRWDPLPPLPELGDPPRLAP